MPRRKRARRGEGSVYKEGDRWRADLRYDAPDGRRRLKRFSAPSEREARARLAAFRAELAAGKVAATGDATVAAYLAGWLRDVVPLRTSSPSTVYGYTYDCKMVGARLGGLRLDRLTPAHVQRLVADLSAGDPATGRKALAPASVRRLLACLRSALRDAVAQGLLARNPCDGVTAPRLSPGGAPRLSLAETLTFIRAAQADPLGPLWLLLLFSGLRVGEGLAVRWGDLDPAAGLVRVAGQIDPVTGQYRPETKGKRERYAPLHPLVWEMLRGGNVGETGAYVGTDVGTYVVPDPAAFVFPWPLDRRTLARRLARLCAGAGLPPVTPHALRRTHGALMAMAGVSLKLVADGLGHANVQTTATFYSRTDADGLRQITAGWERLLGAGDAPTGP